jgi:ferritin-like metal-binding protein YciE
MPRIDSLEALLVNELRDLLDAEHRITKALPKMIKAADSDELSTALQNHLSETENQIERLEQVFTLLEQTAKPKTCAGMKGLLEEGNEHMKEDFTDPSLCDAAIIASAQKVEHYEIAAYGTAATFAKLLGHQEVVELLGESLAEEKKADETLTMIAEGLVNPEAASADEEEEESTSPAGGSRRSSTTRSRSAPARSRRSRTTQQ